MSNESQNILKAFSQKLANCRHEIPLSLILEYFAEGKFGYVVDEKNKKIVTNEYVFADNIASLIVHIRNIVRKPHIFLKKENVIQNVSVANNIDNETTIANYRDDKIWRESNGDLAPEYIHTFVNEDNFATYENRFITFLIDTVYEIITKKINSLKLVLPTLNKMVDENGDVIAYPSKDYLFAAAEENNVVLSNSSPIVKTIGLLINSRKKLAAVKETEYYVACKKAEKFNPVTLQPTNILLGDMDYNYCYMFFMRYLHGDSSVISDKKAYENFVIINLIKALCDEGFAPDANAKVIATSSVTLKLKNVSFTKEPLEVELNTSEDGKIEIAVTVIPDGHTAKFLYSTIFSDDLNGEDINKIADERKAEAIKNGYVDEFIVTDVETVKAANLTQIVADSYEASENMRRLVKLFTLVLEGSEFIHTRICPVCGSNLVAPDEDDFTCVTCKSLYHIFSLGKDDFLWMKHLPTLNAQETAETNAEETEQENVVRLRKSFRAKLSQSTDDTKRYYSELKNYLLSYKRVHSRLSWSVDSYNIGHEYVAKIGFRGKTLALYLALDPADYVDDKKYFVKDVKDVKKFEYTPAMVKIKSDRGLKRAMELIDVLLKDVRKRPIYEAEDFTLPTYTDVKLIELGWAKYGKGSALLSDDEGENESETETQVVVEAKPVSEVPETSGEFEIGDLDEIVATSDGEDDIIRLRKSFSAKLSQSSDEIKEYYNGIKNYLLSYKRVHARTSWSVDSFNVGHDYVAKIGFRGKTLVLFLALDPDRYVDDKKYFVKNVRDIKKFELTPSMVKIKSERGLKRAMELVDEVLKDIGKRPIYDAQDFSIPAYTDDELIEKGLAKYSKSKF